MVTLEQMIKDMEEMAKRACAKEGVVYEEFLADLEQALDRIYGDE